MRSTASLFETSETEHEPWTRGVGNCPIPLRLVSGGLRIYIMPLDQRLQQELADNSPLMVVVVYVVEAISKGWLAVVNRSRVQGPGRCLQPDASTPIGITSPPTSSSPLFSPIPRLNQGPRPLGV